MVDTKHQTETTTGTLALFYGIHCADEHLFSVDFQCTRMGPVLEYHNHSLLAEDYILALSLSRGCWLLLRDFYEHFFSLPSSLPSFIEHTLADLARAYNWHRQVVKFE